MRKTDIAAALVTDLMVACALLTRLPVPRLPAHAFARQAIACWSFPLIGAIVAILAGIAGLASLALGLTAPVAAGVVLTTQIMATGAMHEDGLADSADGLWGGFTRARRLEIMRDSAIGTYGVLALFLSLGLRWGLLEALLPQVGIAAILAAAILSRAALPTLMTTLPHARRDGLSHGVGRPASGTAATAAALGLGLAWLTIGAPVLLAAPAVAISSAAVARLAKARIGGQSGDILGAAQQIAEIAVLMALLVWLHFAAMTG